MKNQIYQPDKLRKSDIFITFQKIHHSFINKLKSKESISQVKTPLSYLANSYIYNYKSSPPVLLQHHVLKNLRRNNDVVIQKPDKGNGVIVLDWRAHVIQETISDKSKFGKLDEDLTLKRGASLECFLHKLYQSNFLNVN